MSSTVISQGEGIADAIHEVLGDKALRQAIIEKRFERTKLFRWETLSQEHIKGFEVVLSSNEKER
jgi:glycosyltransferase involved in cell wall biosynthesis